MTNDLMFYNEVEITWKDNELVNLTKAWKAASGEFHKKPSKWLSKKSTKQFIETVEEKLKGSKVTPLKMLSGRYGGTFAHWQIFLAYAKYLSPEFHMWANDVIKARIEEMKDPGLALQRGWERAVEFYQKRGMTRKQAEHRVSKIPARKRFMSRVGKCGAGSLGWRYAEATDAINQAIIGCGGAEMRDGNKNCRDIFAIEDPSRLDLFAVIEDTAEKLLEQKHVAGRPWKNTIGDISYVANRIKKTVDDILREAA